LASSSAAADLVAQGKRVAFDRKQGNYLSCHMMADGESPGDLGPPLLAMRARFPDASQLKAQIVDPTQSNPGTRMPPFGRHDILSAAEIEAIVAYLYTL
jgi:sulfur-oxidizing protein SoxX